MAKPAEPRRSRFAPVHIETTFEQYRKPGPAPEPTPSPSPRSPRSASPPPQKLQQLSRRRGKEKRRFAPQLVESSLRRSRRAGDYGPATRPTDKTDITPYTNHIYAPKSRRRLATHAQTAEDRVALARRESCDDEIAGGVFSLVARDALRKDAQRKDAQRKLQEVALSAFPNSGVRIGGAEHFYVREGSDSDSIPSRGRTTTRAHGLLRPSRRNSSEEDISWAFKEMQEHAAMLDKLGDRVSSLDLDNMSMDSPPSDAMGLTRAQRQSISGSPVWTLRRTSSSLMPIGEHHMPYVRSESPLPTIGESTMPYVPPELPPIRPIGETFMPYIPSAPAGKAAHMPYVPASQIPAETGFRSQGSPFRVMQSERDPSLERLRNQHRLKNNSPPMLGSDITFRMCPSPKQTKLEPDHLWDLEKGATAEEPNRDVTGEHGLWRGYCYSADKTQQIALAERPLMISTPYPPGTPGDPFARAFSTSAMSPVSLSEEPESTIGHAHHFSASGTLHLEHRSRNKEPKGLHMLQGLEERLRKEKALADLDEKIVREFDDRFVTQVYNYLSLGYPAMARAYDEELSKISRISVEELERDDNAIMDDLWGFESSGCNGAAVEDTMTPVGTNGNITNGHIANGHVGKKVKATGHIMLDSEEHDGVSEEDRCPRWKALKKYIYEWARQHPDLDAISPLAWGMQERRGSWGI